MDKIKPVAWAFKQDWPRLQEDNQECRLLPNFYWGSDLGENSYYEPLYDQSTIDALRAEVEALSNGMTPRGDDMIVPMTLLDEINAVSAGYMTDALRYRWLRECSVVRSDVPCYVIWPTYDNGRYIENTYPDHDRLDAAIDAAMKDAAP